MAQGVFKKVDARGKVPESWSCVDCGINTAPGLFNRVQVEQAFAGDWKGEGFQQTYDNRTEVYLTTEAVWQAAGMEAMGGCLCIGCLEKRLGRELNPNDFVPKHPLNKVPGTERLVSRRRQWTPKGNLFSSC